MKTPSVNTLSMTPPGRQKGVALITALVVVAIATVIATDMLWRTFLDQRRTEAVLHNGQARQYLYGIEEWVGHLMRQAFEEAPNRVSLDQPWAQQLPPLPVEGGQVMGSLEDAQGRFNLNNLAYAERENGNDTPYLAYFKRLLEQLDIPQEYAGAVVDWIDRDPESFFPNGVEDGMYLGLEPAYRAANQGFQDVSELRLVEGFRDPEVFERIEPYVTALPTGEDKTALNVNTADPVLIAAMAPEGGLSVSADTIRDMQEAGGFETVNDFNTALGLNVAQDMFAYGFDSQFFILTARADIGTASATMYSLLFIDKNSGASIALTRSFGAY